MANANSISIRSTKNYKTPSASNLAHNCGLKVATYWLDKNPDLAQSQKIDSYKEVNEIWNQWITEAKELYSKTHQRQIRDDAVIIEEGLIVIGSDVEDRDNLDKLRLMTLAFIEKFEKDNNTKVLYWSIHDHEGKDDEHKNLHVHFFFSNVNNNGDMVRRNWKKSYMAQLQTDIYDASMPYFKSVERAKNYQELGLKAPKHQHHRVFRADAIVNEAKESLQERAKEEDLKEEIAKLQKELKFLHAERKDYARLEQLYRDLKEQLKNEHLTIESLHQQISAQKQLIEALKLNNEPKIDEYAKPQEFINFKPIPIPKITKQTVEIKTGMLSSEKREILPLEEADKLIHYANAVSKQNKELHAQNQALKTENSKLKQAYTNLVTVLKEYTKFDKLLDAVEAIKQRFIKSSVKQQVKEHKELDTFDKSNKLVQEVKQQSHVRKNRG